jgi:BirA family biotin operon repressor/biotin-[acetyl-CoA-carboxylase] ligase
MTPDAFRLLARLADGALVSGSRLADEHGLAPAAVRGGIRQLRRAGVPVEGVRGRGYRLCWPLPLLDDQRLEAALAGRGIGHEIRSQVASTNAELAARFGHRHALLAEYQTAGRGRRGRGWSSPPAAGIWLSFGYRFDLGLSGLGALALAAGLAAADALERAGVPVAMKWPNDLVAEGRKLGGVLVEGRGDRTGPCDVVVGVGINVRLPQTLPAPRQPWTDVHRLTGVTPDRNGLAAAVIVALDRACARFADRGLTPFLGRWRQLDALAGREIEVAYARGTRLHGRADGINRRGELRVRAAAGTVHVNAGEVRVRRA